MNCCFILARILQQCISVPPQAERELGMNNSESEAIVLRLIGKPKTVYRTLTEDPPLIPGSRSPHFRSGAFTDVDS